MDGTVWGPRVGRGMCHHRGLQCVVHERSGMKECEMLLFITAFRHTEGNPGGAD